MSRRTTKQRARDPYAERLRALELRIDRLRSGADVVRLFGEWCLLEEWWLHASDNAEALRILTTARENAAWERARRRFVRAREAWRTGHHDVARRLWREGLCFLSVDWETMYRRAPVPDVPPFDDS